LWGCALSFALAGPAFVAYANIDVSNTPLLWAFRRFFLLPHVIVAPFVALGAVKLVEILASRVDRARHRGVQIGVASAAFALIVVMTVVRYPTLDQSRNHLAHTFAQDILATVEPNSVVIALGDESVFPLAYAQAVEKARRMSRSSCLGCSEASTGTFESCDGGIPHSSSRFSITIRATRPRHFARLIEANPARPFAFVDPPADGSLASSHWLYRRGVVEQVEPLSKDISLDAAERGE
jgi:hypothetical protein